MPSKPLRKARSSHSVETENHRLKERLANITLRKRLRNERYERRGALYGLFRMIQRYEL